MLNLELAGVLETQLFGSRLSTFLTEGKATRSAECKLTCKRVQLCDVPSFN